MSWFGLLASKTVFAHKGTIHPMTFSCRHRLERMHFNSILNVGTRMVVGGQRNVPRALSSVKAQ